MIALRSRRILAEEGWVDGFVAIEHGKVVSIGGSVDGAVVEDLGDAVLMAGLVDAHVHVNEPGRTEWEGFKTATAAAAVGGITTLVDMPLNCIPVTTTAAALREKLAVLDGKLAVDVAFWGGVVPGNASDLADLAEAGIVGAKCFLCHSGIDDFPASTADDLRVAMPVLRDAGIPLLVHAELESEAPHPGDPRDYATFLASRPNRWEDDAIAVVIDLVRETGCPAHIVHLSSATALPMLAAARAEGLPITVETCPHYLCLRAEDVPTGDTAFKCCPPIREDANRDALWQGLRDGIIDQVVSDHSPCVPGLKLPERGDFLEAWGGIASLQLGLSAVWTEARARGFTLEHLAQWMSRHPAKLAGLANKGRLRVGADADLVAWRPEASFRVDPSQLLHRHKVTPYADRELFGVVEGTWLRGECVAREGRVVGEARGAALLR
ncbi:MAG: allantoinase AllB [Deltaproteobacteria bacterium]|nr:MAG: allantoinase AllB [Deltaproteobacteria bacterium]